MYNYDANGSSLIKIPYPLTERRSVNDLHAEYKKRQFSEESGVYIYHNGKLTKFKMDLSPKKDSIENSENPISTRKKTESPFDSKIRLSYSTERPKLPSLYNQQHLDLRALFETKQIRSFNADLFVKFSKSYDLEFIEGYKDELLDRCVHLLSLENDIDYLDLNFSSNFCRKYVDQRDSIFNTPQPSKYEKMSISEENFNCSPNIMSLRRTQKPKSQEKRSFSVKPKVKVRPISTDEFKSEMGFFHDFQNVCKFYLINALNNGAKSDFGFFEIARESGSKVVQISKFYVAKIFRKMGLVPSIAMKIVSYVFSDHIGVEKIFINLKSPNTDVHKDLASISFKFERNNPKLPSFSIYSLTKKDFVSMLNKF